MGSSRPRSRPTYSALPDQPGAISEAATEEVVAVLRRLVIPKTKKTPSELQLGGAEHRIDQGSRDAQSR